MNAIFTANNMSQSQRNFSSSIVNSSFEKFFIELENEQDSRAIQTPLNSMDSITQRKPLLLARSCPKSHRTRQFNKSTTSTTLKAAPVPAPVSKHVNATNIIEFSKKQKALKRF
ncbi:hypothetical protein C6P45_004888 [Maudiozyma exigua]|uniref:Uncharacterized protein n=1 Tax=Maudiozyma exigua TaxID=34358 RepID=A0A9P6WC22_MAUEX|nr:hypothetical protein C6P45_004888 [Kazachstania exigua]